jgi:activator of 2-hydroxyglutaryl-CoA dehydratase
MIEEKLGNSVLMPEEPKICCALTAAIIVAKIWEGA